ncbi:hypothetical protein QTP88_026460 [Uroleucon formosanum]
MRQMSFFLCIFLCVFRVMEFLELLESKMSERISLVKMSLLISFLRVDLIPKILLVNIFDKSLIYLLTNLLTSFKSSRYVDIVRNEDCARFVKISFHNSTAFVFKFCKGGLTFSNHVCFFQEIIKITSMLCLNQLILTEEFSKLDLLFVKFNIEKPKCK